MGSSRPAQISHLVVQPHAERAPAWSLQECAGRLVELSGEHAAAHLTAAFGLVLEAQFAGDSAAWIALERGTFFPPDVAAGGVDLDALPVVRIPDARAALRAADHLVRSGGFGLVVIDLSDGDCGAIAVPMLTRLLGLARMHDAAILILTRKPSGAPSLNSLISLRVEAARCDNEKRFDVQVRVLKDKRSGPGSVHAETCDGPPGLR